MPLPFGHRHPGYIDIPGMPLPANEQEAKKVVDAQWDYRMTGHLAELDMGPADAPADVPGVDPGLYAITGENCV